MDRVRFGEADRPREPFAQALFELTAEARCGSAKRIRSFYRAS